MNRVFGFVLLADFCHGELAFGLFSLLFMS